MVHKMNAIIQQIRSFFYSHRKKKKMRNQLAATVAENVSELQKANIEMCSSMSRRKAKRDSGKYYVVYEWMNVKQQNAHVIAFVNQIITGKYN